MKLGMFISDTSPSQVGIDDLIERAQWAEAKASVKQIILAGIGITRDTAA